MSQYDYIGIVRTAIEKECFVTTEVQEISNRTPTLVDFRKVFLKHSFLDAYSEIFWDTYKDTSDVQVCGLEITAIPLLTAIVMKYEERGKPINAFVIRKSRKKSGLLKDVEGYVTEDPVIIIDDIINSGSSVMRQVEVVGGLSLKVEEIFTILRYRDNSYYTVLQERKIPLRSIFELNDFSKSLALKNLDFSDKKQLPNPFESEALWYVPPVAPNYFYVVPKSGPVISEGVVFYGTDDGTFFARTVMNGEVLWRYKIPFCTQGKFIFSTPAIYNDLVFFGAYDGNFYALNKKNGVRVWMFMEADWIGSSPCIAEELEMVFVGLEFGLFKKQGGVVGLHATTGEKIWEFRSEMLTHGSPAYSKKFGLVSCGSNDGILYTLHAKSGELLWKFETGGAIKYAPYFSDEHGVIIVIGHSDTVYVLDSKTGKVVSSYNMEFGGYSTPVVTGNKVICTSYDKNVHCFNLQTGSLIWKFDTDARCLATPLLVDKNIYVGANNGRVFELNSETGVMTGVLYTRERIVNKIAYDPVTKIFIIPTFGNELIATKKKALP
jgi:outer membrane protein assembly factor BamB/orotate phosphoribosyltransferase